MQGINKPETSKALPDFQKTLPPNQHFQKEIKGFCPSYLYPSYF